MDQRLFKADNLEAVALIQGCNKEGFLDQEAYTKMNKALIEVKKLEDFKNAHVKMDTAYDTLIFDATEAFSENSENDEKLKALNEFYGAKIKHDSGSVVIHFDYPMDIVSLQKIYSKAISGASFKFDHKAQSDHRAYKYENPGINFRIESDGIWHFTVYSKKGQWTAQYDPKKEKVIGLTGFDYDEVPSWCNIS
jgi:hypothetical protein